MDVNIQINKNLGFRWKIGQYYDPAALTPREGLGTHLIGGWVGLRAGPVPGQVVKVEE